jgi:beta-carotene hydroxylase
MGAFMLVILFAWLVHRPYNKTKRYENTSTFVFPGISDSIITWMWLFQNYHSVHHLFPKVPFYKYRELYLKIENVMIKKNAPIIRIMGAK